MCSSVTRALAVMGVISVLLTIPSLATADPYADAVISYTPGAGVKPDSEYDDPNAALGAPEADPANPSPGSAVSLGDGGSIVLAFTDNIIVDGPGYDLNVIELGKPERGEILVSDDGGATFVSLGIGAGGWWQMYFDLSGTGLTYVNAIKIVDEFGVGGQGLPYAGMDIDAVVALNSVDVVNVDIDIKPGSYPNSINLGSQGVVPVAILSSLEFDATTVNPDSVTLEGAGVAVRGKGNKSLAHEEDVNGDGLTDLVCQVETVNFAEGAFQDGYGYVTGQTTDGIPFEACDEVVIVPE